MRKILFGVLGSALFMSCGDVTKSTSASRQKKAWNDAHNPRIMETGSLKEQKYIFKFESLPLQGKLSKLPWSDDYWADWKGGLTFRWFGNHPSEVSRYKYPILNKSQVPNVDLKTLSPLEKFDIFMGDYDFPRTKLERKRTEVMSNSNIPAWTGLCDNWAPATLFFLEPGPVMLKGKRGDMVPFGSSDVKALLIYFLKEAEVDSKFLGTRCDWDIADLQRKFKRGLISKNTYEARMEECSGVNAGAFHIVMANQLGRLDEGFIFDKDGGPEVWNQPAKGFTSKVLVHKKKKSPGAAPATVSEVEIETILEYIEEKDQSWDKNSETGEDTIEYHYRVELDKDGMIIGGAWLDEDHPDFAWKQPLPTFRGDTEYEAIKQIYEAAVGKQLPEHFTAPNKAPEKIVDNTTPERRPNRFMRMFRRNPH